MAYFAHVDQNGNTKQNVNTTKSSIDLDPNGFHDFFPKTVFYNPMLEENTIVYVSFQIESCTAKPIFISEWDISI